jgi:hypothetical protein
MKKYEWAVVGSGIAGISIAEILTRNGHDVILIEKNKKLASETTRDFHEWLHTGALYTLIPDRLTTLRFILGAVDDLIEYYSCYDNMNITPTGSGLKINASESGWFNDSYIHFKYRLNKRKILFPWLYGIARSIYLIERIGEHDWLRRRAGEIRHYKIGRKKRILNLIAELIKSNDIFYDLQTTDFTINSRNLLNDMVSTSLSDGLELSLNNEILSIKKEHDYKVLSGSKEEIRSENVVVCNGGVISSLNDIKTKTSYAPIAVVSGVSKNENSFVELDYFPKKCINLLTKNNGIGLAGGISLSKKEKCDEYLDYVVKEHQKINPKIKEISRYIGLKNEVTNKRQDRSYLYHIINSDEGIWNIIPGKFTLAFSLAPEFYRRIYNINAKKRFHTKPADINSNQYVSNTVWKDSLNNLMRSQ